MDCTVSYIAFTVQKCFIYFLLSIHSDILLMEEKKIILKQYQTSSQPFEYILPLRMRYILNVILLKDTGNEMLDKKKRLHLFLRLNKSLVFFL